MTDKINNTLKDLEWDIQPGRDLWADIDSNIRFSGKPQRLVDSMIEHNDSSLVNSTARTRKGWVPIAVAACAIMAVGSVIMSGLSLQRANQTYELQAKMVEYQQSHIALMEQEHRAVRAQFVQFIDSQASPLRPEAARELKATLATFDQATSQLKEAMINQPTNTRYASTLADTYQQEAELLNKIKAQASRSL